jgi:succinoglycan biosynthesis transport protein ExoP
MSRRWSGNIESSRGILDSAQLKYQEIRAKQTEVQVSQNLETEHKGERFTMIEPPLPPEKPVSPNRLF